MNKRNDEVDAFQKKLNGTIGHYEKMCYNISRYLSDNKNITDYLSVIEDSELKMSLQKWMEEKEKNPKFVYAADLWVTPNVLRKLIFEWNRFGEIAFKEYFVLGCYCYAEVDRNKVLKNIDRKLPVSPVKEKRVIKSNGDTETVNPYKVSKANFRLLPLDDKGTDPDILQFEYKGEPVELNRKNLDPANNTITSKVQAQIYNKDGEWYLANCSELKTTYVQVTKPVKLIKEILSCLEISTSLSIKSLFTILTSDAASLRRKGKSLQGEAVSLCRDVSCRRQDGVTFSI